MNYTCKGAIHVEEDDEKDCGHEFDVSIASYRPATRYAPAEGGECSPSECPICGAEVDAAEVMSEMDAECDDSFIDDCRDSNDNSLNPQVAAQEFGGMNYP